MRYYKVKFGFGEDEFISVDETEVAMALRAQLGGRIGVFKEGTVAGDKIMTITPDYNRAMGWNRTYKPTSEDYGDIPAKITSQHRVFLENAAFEITGVEKPKAIESSPEAKRLAENMRIK